MTTPAHWWQKRLSAITLTCTALYIFFELQVLLLAWKNSYAVTYTYSVPFITRKDVAVRPVLVFPLVFPDRKGGILLLPCFDFKKGHGICFLLRRPFLLTTPFSFKIMLLFFVVRTDAAVRRNSSSILCRLPSREGGGRVV